jgi:energy-coupling factor transporter transmembrane protein EcfT
VTTEAAARRRWLLVIAVSALLLSLFGLFVAWFFWGFKCDEGCREPATSWSSDAHAWQWTGQFVLAGVATCLAAVAAIARNVWNCATAMSLSAAAWILWLMAGPLAQ